jgi:hypothetical protein
VSGFDDPKVALELRDIIRVMVEENIERLRPSNKYGTVQSIDSTNNRATVLMAGENAPLTAPISGVMSVGDRVRLMGPQNDRYFESADVQGLWAERYFTGINAFTGTFDVNPLDSIAGSVLVPVAPYQRIALVGFTMLVTSSGDLDAYLIVDGVAWSRSRKTTGTETIQHHRSALIPANTAMTFSVGIGAGGAGITANNAGGHDLNFIEVTTVRV